MKLHAFVFAPVVVLLLSACSAEPERPAGEPEGRAVAAQAASPAPASPAPATSDAAGTATAATEQADMPALVVHKTPWCGCCTLWAEQAKAAGFEVSVREVEDLSPIKQALGVPESHASCHTGEVDGYFVEGHVPFEDLRRLLAERPDARGLAVPGMPLGSPGMETPDGRTQPFDVLLVEHDGSSRVYARHGDAE